MKRKKHLHMIASFLIALVITIPINISAAYAVITKVSAKGSNGIEGYAKQQDSLAFTVEASIPNEKITKDQVFLGTEIKFDKCSAKPNNGSECTLKFPQNGTEEFEARAIPYTINLYRNDSSLDDSESGEIIIDNKAPQITLATSQNTFSSQQQIQVNYEARDFACDDPSCSGKCVGIKSIDFYTLDNKFKQTVNPQGSSCSISANFSINPNVLQNGMNSVFAKATDLFGQISQETSVTFEVDTAGPAISQESFMILGKGVELSTFSPAKAIPVEVVVNITESSLNPDSVVADLSSLNPSQNLANAKPSCNQASQNLYRCKWTLDLNPQAEGPKTITINASDNIGNKASASISKQLSLDNLGPVVQSLATQATSESGSFATPRGNTVTAVFEDATGLSADGVFLHVAQSKIKATKCARDASWTCTWNDVAFGMSSTVKISIESDTTDIFGNAVAESRSLDVAIDNKIPVLHSMNLSSVSGLGQAFPEVFKVGDKIGVVANLSEDNGISAVADFSKFISNATNVAGSCQKIGTQAICTWLTSTINLEASDAITFNFTDSAGNSLIAKKQLTTLGLDESGTPDFWSSTVVCSPRTIDRNLGPLINQRLFCQVKLTPKREGISTVFISAQGCTSTPQIIEDFELLNAEQKSRSPFIKITLKKDEYRIDNATISCSLNIFSKHDNVVTKSPEIENAEVFLQFYNPPLGELEEGVQDKIDDAIKNANDNLKIIGQLKKIFDYSKKLCQLINTVYSILALFYILTIGIKQTARACSATVFGEIAGVCSIVDGIGFGTCGSTEGSSAAADKSKNVLNKFCDFITCKEAHLWGKSVENWINNLPLAGNIGPTTEEIQKQNGKKQDGTTFDYNQQRRYGLRPLSQYMDPNDNFLVAALLVCVPGMIYGLDKYRQIQCLYADCLQNAVAQEGLPITACEDQKYYATCKYITGEIFAVIPWVAVFDHFTGIIKEALSNPFTTLGVAVSLICGSACPIPRDGGFAYNACRAARLFNLVGDAANNVKNIIDEGTEIRQDYCTRLEGADKKEDKKEEEGEP